MLPPFQLSGGELPEKGAGTEQLQRTRKRCLRKEAQNWWLWARLCERNAVPHLLLGLSGSVGLEGDGWLPVLQFQGLGAESPLYSGFALGRGSWRPCVVPQWFSIPALQRLAGREKPAALGWTRPLRQSSSSFTAVIFWGYVKDFFVLLKMFHSFKKFKNHWSVIQELIFKALWP